MMFHWLVSAALAGTIRIHASSPVNYRIDGEVVGRMVTDVTLTDIPAGAHSIEVVDAFGAILASTDVILTDREPLWFDYMNRRLLRVDTLAVGPADPGNRGALTDAQFTWIEHRIARKRKDEKRLKRLGEVIDKYWFEMRHVDSLLIGFTSLEARVTASKMLAPRTIDPEKTKAIEDHFPPGNFRDRAIAAFVPYQRPEEEDE